MSQSSVLLTSGNEFQPLRVSGIQVVQTYRQIVGAVERAFDERHATLFAEPSIDHTTGDIIWYARRPGEARPLSALAPEDRRAAELILDRLVANIYQHAAGLAASPDRAAHVVAENLRLALEIPHEDSVVVVGDQPVLVGWGHVPRGPAAPRHLLRELAKRHLDEARRAEEQAAAAVPPPADEVVVPVKGSLLGRLSRLLPTWDSSRRVEEEGGRIGAVNVVLSWDTDDDLDLHVTCPDGQKIYFANKSACGGTLDVDRNAGAGSIVERPVENIVWDAGKAPAGNYLVEVVRFAARSSEEAPTPFVIELKINGETVETRHGESFSEDVSLRVLEFELPWTGN